VIPPKDGFAYNNTMKCQHLKLVFSTFHKSFRKLSFHINFYLIVGIIRHVKLLMDILHILYVDIEDEFTMYATTSLIHKVVLGTLVPYHMAQFFIGFNITNVSIRLDLYFN
jgi:hypothetical protein